MARAWGLRRLLSRSRTGRDGEAATSAGKLIQLGDFAINMVERKATVQGENLTLTSEEFDVLVFLTNHPQRCVTPRTVLATNWTDDDRHQTEFLKALLSLRRKLETVAGGKQYLRTEPWVVYRFEPRPSFAA